MKTRFAVRLVSTAAVVCGWCATALAEENPAERLNPITFRGVNFRGDLALWTAVVFLVVLWVLWRFAWRPIAAGLDKRERKIADDIAGAEEANRKAKELLDQHQKKLDSVADEVRTILEEGRRDAEKLGRVLIEKAKKDAELEQQRALQRIEVGHGRRPEGARRPQRRAGRRTGRTHRRPKTQPPGPRSADRAGRRRIRTKKLK